MGKLLEMVRIKRMRHFWTLLLTTVVLVTMQWRVPAIAGTARHYEELTFPPLPEIQLPEYAEYQLENGMTVFLIEDRELPLVSGTALFKTGSRWEPANKVGLASLVGEVMRTGGTRSHSPSEVNQILEQKAAAVETSIGQAVGVGEFNCLSEDTAEVLKLFSEIIRQPRFESSQLELGKTQKRGEIARRNDDSDKIAGREFRKLIYGSDSPYARTIEYETLDNISREDVVKFYEQSFYPNNTILGIVGDFRKGKMRKLIEENFGDWESNPEFKAPELPKVSPANLGGVFMVDRPQLTQSSILLGHLGGQLNSPDFAALSVMNEVLNGFSGRLFNELRSRQGLAYSVYGFWSAKFDYPGLFIGGGQTRSPATVPLIQAMLAELEKIRSTPISAEELKNARDSVLNSFVFNFARPSQILSRLLRYKYYGYPEDFIFKYRQGVESTTIGDVQRVAKENLKPEEIVMLVVGNQQEIQPPLSSVSPDTKVTSIDITIPEPS